MSTSFSAPQTACIIAGGGVPTLNTGSGCADGSGAILTLVGNFQQLLNSYSLTLIDARETVLNGGRVNWMVTPTPRFVADNILGEAKSWCAMYPGVCPSDPATVSQQYAQAALDMGASYGFGPNGDYSSTLDSSDPGIAPTDIQPAPLAANSNLVSYSPNAGYRLPLDALPPTMSPTSPAFVTPENMAATSMGNNASGGGSDIHATASGVGPSVGGSVTQQTTMQPTPAAVVVAAAAPAIANPGGMSGTLILILIGVVILVAIAGRD